MKRFTIRAAAFALSAAVLYASSCGTSYAVSGTEDIVRILGENGVEVRSECTQKTVTIPEEFGEVYESYNELQQKQGFDLYDYRSHEAEVYTFDVIEAHGDRTPGAQAHVMVCGGKIIGGDISTPAIDGSMQPLFGEE